MAAALGTVGADPSVGYCACLRRELSGEPDAGNLHLRFDEGRVGRATCVALSPTLPYFASFTTPTISNASPGFPPKPLWNRLPIGFCPAKNFLAKVWFTMATLGDSGTSLRLKSRP